MFTDSREGLLRQCVVVCAAVMVVANPHRLLRFREMHRRDLAAAADIHYECLRHGLFPQLGRRFLRAYLATFIDSPHAVALVAVTHGGPVGFLVGTFEDADHYRFVLRRHGLRLALRGSAAILLRPRVALHFARTRARRYARAATRLAGGAVASAASVAGVPTGVLAHVAVAPAGRGRGMGAGLVDEFAGRASARGLRALRLVTRADGQGAGDFYWRLGWQMLGTHGDRDGVTWARYRLELA